MSSGGRSAAGDADKDIPYLEKAIQLGEKRAHYTLAVIYIKRGEANKTLPEFRAYLKAYPENAVATKMVSELESGKSSVDVVNQKAARRPIAPDRFRGRLDGITPITIQVHLPLQTLTQRRLSSRQSAIPIARDTGNT